MMQSVKYFEIQTNICLNGMLTFVFINNTKETCNDKILQKLVQLLLNQAHA